MTQITIKDLSDIRKRFSDKKIVFCSGNFDLTHVGHILFFEDCKKHGDILVVGVGGDYILKINKNNRLVLNEKIRLKTVDSLKPVDFCFIDDVSTKENPLFLLDVVFENLKPDIYVINEDSFNQEYRENLCKRRNISIKILKRYCPEEFEKISTTKIIKKINSL